MENKWQQSVDQKLDRILNDLDFVKNRTATYLGRNEAITYLADETPIFVNTDDSGCPLNFINGGLYEEDYFRVFLSFRDTGLPMLDVGANLGVYSLKMAPHMRGHEIHAFEPIPRIRNLLSRSAFLNGFSDRICIHPFAVSDRSGVASLAIPTEHAGGASLETADQNNCIAVDVKCLDDFFSADFSCGLVKLDVEGHELHALRGMRRILGRSPNSIVMFEKLSPNSGIERDIYDFFTGLGWRLYGIEGRVLVEIGLDGFSVGGGYFIAAPAGRIGRDELNRDFFTVFPSDLNILEGEKDGESLCVDITEGQSRVVFHGPYWWLPRGYYRLSLDGNIDKAATLDVCEKFGYKVFELRLEPDRLSIDFPVYRDLAKFELVMRPLTNSRFRAVIRKITLTHLG